MSLIDRDAIDHDIIDRAILRTRWDRGDPLDDVVTLDNLTEDGVATVQPRRLRDRDEELATVGVRPGIGHGQTTGSVERGSAWRTLIFESVARASRSGSRRVASLDHEVLDHAMEDGAFVQGFHPHLSVTWI